MTNWKIPARAGIFVCVGVLERLCWQVALLLHVKHSGYAGYWQSIRDRQITQKLVGCGYHAEGEGGAVQDGGREGWLAAAVAGGLEQAI